MQAMRASVLDAGGMHAVRIRFDNGMTADVLSETAGKAAMRRFVPGVFLGDEFADITSVTLPDGRKFDGNTDDPVVISITDAFHKLMLQGEPPKDGTVIYEREEE